MSGSLTIVVYHYVREIKQSRYPSIKGLEIEGFRRQLDYLSKRFNIVSMEDLITCFVGTGKGLNDTDCLLTFDDGYKDHIEFVLPELRKSYKVEL